MKKVLLGILVMIVIALLVFRNSKEVQAVSNVITSYTTPASTYIHKEGTSVKTRVSPLEGYHSIVTSTNSFSNYVQNFPLKEASAQVINYDGKPYWYQAGHVGVLDIPVPSNGLQQCADALIRIRSEYLWEQNLKDKIGFKFTSGHYCSWSYYAKGYRPTINGNNVNFSIKATPNASKNNFYNYLNLIYTYAGTYSLAQELSEIKNLSDVQIGDMLIYPGFPGHVMMIADIIENQEGERRFLFFQGNTPAQSVHIIRNSTNAKESPWYDLKGLTSLETPIYTFSSFKIVRFK